MIKASIDLMGGSLAPESILKAASRISEIYFVFSGTQECKELIEKYKIQNFDFIQTELIIKDGEKYNNADLEKSSMYSAIMQLNLNKSDFVVSGGTTGYYMLLAKRIIGMLPGITRPALASLIPTRNQKAIMMDLGANLTCSDENLVKFAIMGTILAQFWLDIQNPKVGFLNVGNELGKGPEIIKNAFNDFAKIYDGDVKFIEGNEIFFQDIVDVVITDGFTGNCLLKFAEGSSKLFKQILTKAFSQNLFAKIIGLISKKILKSAIIDSRHLNGAIFAGINGCIIKSHGNSDDVAYEAAIRFGAKIAANKQELIKKMEQMINSFVSCKHNNNSN